MAKKPSSKARNTPDKESSLRDDSAEDVEGAIDDGVTSEETPEDADAQVSAEDSTEPLQATDSEAPEPDLRASETTKPDEAPEPLESDTISAEDTVTGTDDSETQDDNSNDNRDHGTEKSPATLPATAPQPEKGPGAAPLVMGGIAAGAIGFAAAYFGLAQQPAPRDEGLVSDVAELSQRVEEQSGTIESLTEKVGGIANTDDSALEAQIEALGTLSERVASTETQVEELVAQLGAVDERLSGVELRPVSESADAATITAYENELNAAREEIAAQREELQALIDEAMNTENAADKAARASIQRAATSRILAALESGAGFAAAVADLETTGVEVPETLASVDDSGVPSLSSLQESFPDAARAALNVSRSVSNEESGLTGFLRSQLGARSLEPREGDDPDAVLSRAEAAVRDGRLRDALAEIETLPEEGRAELSDWAGQAALRLEAVGAAQSLSETLK